MAKKARRVRRSAKGKERRSEKREMPASSPPASPKSPTSNRNRIISRSTYTPTEAELREEYSYVLRDLRRVFILAGAMFVLLILLNLVLR